MQYKKDYIMQKDDLFFKNTMYLQNQCLVHKNVIYLYYYIKVELKKLCW